MNRFFVAFFLLGLAACKTPTGGDTDSTSEVLASKPAKAANINPEMKVITEPFPAPRPGELALCSYNISFLGAWPQKQNAALVDLVKNCDVVVIQELAYPNDKAAGGNDVTIAFFDEMANAGLDGWILSEGKTGPTNGNLGRNADYFVAFYKKARIQHAEDLPNGWLEQPTVKNPRFDRVPYAFGFRAVKSGSKKPVDFVMISVHLHPTEGSNIAAKVADKAFRVFEFGIIQDWINAQDSTEKDYIILGDTNIEDQEEYNAITGNPSPAVKKEMTSRGKSVGKASAGLETTYTSLNAVVGADGTVQMNGTNLKMEKPYDHVFYNTETSTEIKRGMNMIDTVKFFRPNGFLKKGDTVGDITLDKDEAAIHFTGFYSDHDPVQFFMTNDGDDD